MVFENMSDVNHIGDFIENEEKDMFSYLSYLKCNENKLTVQEFISKFKVPQMIVICGNFEICVGTSIRFIETASISKLCLFAWRKNCKFKVQATCYSSKGELSPPFVIHNDYRGLFEIRTKVGPRLLRIHKVDELPLFRNKPFMVMESIHAYRKTTCGKWQKCTLQKGYKMMVRSIWTEDESLRVSKRGILLRCVSFHDESVYLPLEEEGDFALLGGPRGLQTISSLGGFEFPIDVQLVDGHRPPEANGVVFSPFMRLSRKLWEGTLTVWTMDEYVPFINIPIECPMKVMVLDNLEDVLKHPFHGEIVHHVKKIS